MNKDDVAGLVERLLVPDVYGYQGRKQAEEANTLRQEAADALTTLSARVETLEAALRRCFKGETQAIIPFTNPLLSSEVRR